MSADLHVTGAKGIALMLNDFEPRLRKKVIGKSIRAAMKKHALPDAIANAPVGATGQLQKLMTVRVAKLTKKQRRGGVKSFGFAVLPREKPSSDGSKLPRSIIARMLEFGTKHIKERKWLRDALYNNAKAMKEDVRRDVAKEVIRIARESRNKSPGNP